MTYFFNGGREEPWPGEDRKLIPSLKIATYDLQPAMAAEGVCDALVAAIEGGTYDLIVANFANPDMVGHTGVWEATIKACETVDACLGRVADAILAVDAGDPAAPGAVMFITADHGNADEMKDEAGNPITKHSLNPVPLLGIGRFMDGKRLRGRPPRGRHAHDPGDRRPEAMAGGYRALVARHEGLIRTTLRALPQSTGAPGRETAAVC